MKAYLTFMTKVGVLLGGDEESANNQMRDVLEFETQLAKVLITCSQQSTRSLNLISDYNTS